MAAITFTQQFRGLEVEVRADDYEYSPDIGIRGPQVLSAVYADTGEDFEMTEHEEDIAFEAACEIFESDG